MKILVFSPGRQTVEELTSRVNQLTEQISFLEHQIGQLRHLSGTSPRPIGFSVQFKSRDKGKLSENKTLLFEELYNEGNDYNPATGCFTAPSVGAYLFYVNVVRPFPSLMPEDEPLEVIILHGDKRVATANAYIRYLNSGSNMVVLYLKEGDTVQVRIHKGTQVHGATHTSFTGIKLS